MLVVYPGRACFPHLQINAFQFSTLRKGLRNYFQ